MKTVRNKTQRPLSIPLPGGKRLHLGPGKTGHISSTAVDFPQLKNLIDTGEIEVLGEGTEPTGGAPGSKNRGTPAHGHMSGSGGRRAGDR